MPLFCTFSQKMHNIIQRSSELNIICIRVECHTATTLSWKFSPDFFFAFHFLSQILEHPEYKSNSPTTMHLLNILFVAPALILPMVHCSVDRCSELSGRLDKIEAKVPKSNPCKISYLHFIPHS